MLTLTLTLTPTPTLNLTLTLTLTRLYGFDTGLLQLEQLHVDEAHRGALGAVESTLCSLGTHPHLRTLTPALTLDP